MLIVKVTGPGVRLINPPELRGEGKFILENANQDKALHVEVVATYRLPDAPATNVIEYNANLAQEQRVILPVDSENGGKPLHVVTVTVSASN